MILEDMWLDADEFLVEFEQSGFANPFFRGALVAACSMIYLVSKPYFESVEDVKKELMTRRSYFNEHGTLEGHITPGAKNITLFPEEPIVTYKAEDGGYTQNPAYAVETPVGYPESRVKKKSTKTTRQISAPVVSDSVIAQIKQQAAAGFDIQVLSTLHNVPQPIIEGILKG